MKNIFLLACRLLAGNFHRNNPNRTLTFCPLMRGVHYFFRYFNGFLSEGIYSNFACSSNFCLLSIGYSECPLKVSVFSNQLQKNILIPCFIITVRNFTMTFDDGLIKTCLFPRFSALQMLFKQSFKTLTRTITATFPNLEEIENMIRY